MIHKIEYEFNQIKLNSLKEENIEDLRLLRNKDENRKCFIFCNKISKQDQQKWFESYKNKPDDYMFYVSTTKKPYEFIGSVALYNIDTNKKSAEFGRIIIDKDKINEKGIGYDTTIATCQVAFNILNLELVYLEVFEDNIRAIKTYEKSGFKKIKSYKIKDGKTIIYMEKNKSIN